MLRPLQSVLALALLFASHAIGPTVALGQLTGPDLPELKVMTGPKVSIPFNNVVTDLILGGGGRYACAYIALESKVLVVDLNERKLAGEIPTDRQQVSIAAGLDHLFISRGNESSIERWDMAKCERLETVRVEKVVRSISMGAGAKSPLLVIAIPADAAGAPKKVEVSLFDPQSLKPMGDAKLTSFAVQGPNFQARASFDGQAFGIVSARMGDQIRVSGKTFQMTPTSRNEVSGYLAPGENGKTFYKMSKDDGTGSPENQVPAECGSYYLTIFGENKAKAEKSVGTVHVAGQSQPIGKLPDIPHRMRSANSGREVLFVPQSKMLVAMQSGNSANLVLMPLDVEQFTQTAANPVKEPPAANPTAKPPESVATGGGAAVKLPEIKPFAPRAPDPARGELGQNFVLPLANQSVTDAAVGGGGRYLCLLIAEERKVLVVDLCEGKLLGTIPATKKSVMAAGAEKLILVSREGGSIERWDLATRVREVNEKLDRGEAVRALAIGAGTNGPMLVARGNEEVKDRSPMEISFFDPQTMKPLGAAPKQTNKAQPTRSERVSAFASYQGKVFTVCGNGSDIVRFGGTTILLEPSNVSGKYLIPSSQGSDFYSTKLLNRTEFWSDAPAIDGDTFVTISSAARTATERTIGSIRRPGSPNPVAALPDAFTRLADLQGKQIVFVPKANLLVLVRPDSLEFVSLPMDTSPTPTTDPVDGPGGRFVIRSTPPEGTAVGQELKYQVVTKSESEKRLTFKLEYGPQGMTVSPTGELRWKAPVTAKPAEHVIVSVADEAKNELLQHFTLAVEGAKGTATVTKPLEPTPAKGPPEIAPPKVQADQAVIPLELPAPFDHFTVGGSGRYLALWLPSLRHVAIVDVAQAKVLKFLPVKDEQILLAAGEEHLVVLEVVNRRLVRINLKTLEEELRVPIEVSAPIVVMAMGSGSYGPIVIGHGKVRGNDAPVPLVVDLKALKPIGATEELYPGQFISRNTRASADGRLFTHWSLENGIGDFDPIARTGHQYPDPDRSSFSQNWIRIDSVAGSSYLQVVMPGSKAYVRIEGNQSFAAPVELLSAALKGEDVREGGLPFQRILFAPVAQRIVYVPKVKERLTFVRFDLDKALARSAADYLYIASTPPRRVAPGKRMSYPLDVRSKSGGVKYTIESGPAGIKLSAAGLLEWDVPASAKESELVVLSISDSAGNQAFETFRLNIDKDASLSPPARAPEKVDAPATADPPVVAAEPKKIESKKGDPAALAQGVEMRTWRDRSGTEIQARYLGLEKGKVRLEQANGVIVEWSTSNLSSADFDYVSKLRKR